MPFTTDNLILRIEDEPHYIHALVMNPAQLEPELQVGKWLLLHSAVWSGPDMVAINPAIQFAKAYNGLFNLGIRLTEGVIPFFENYNPKGWRTCHWLFLRDGNVENLLIGRFDHFTQDKLRVTIKDVFGR